MPTYQYSCADCGHFFEQVQSFSEDSLTVCPRCQGRLRKVFNAVGVVFKGSGFYRTDSRADAAKDGAKGEVEHGAKDGARDGAKDGAKGAAKSDARGSDSRGSGTSEKKTESAGSGTKAAAGTSAA